MMKVLIGPLLVALALMLQACSDDKAEEQGAHATPEAKASAIEQLTVYKTPTCGCCGAWVEHVQGAGWFADVVNQDSVAHVKDRFAIPRDARSCHTAVSDSGYVFEGHVPAKYMEAFLAAPAPDAIGLVVPAMPIGSPGMEVDDRFQPYRIFQLNKDGSLQVYANIESYAQQF